MRHLTIFQYGIALTTLATILVVSLPSVASRVPELAGICSKECPGSKDNADVLNCAESKEHDPEFKKSKCGQEHAKLEKMMGGHHDHSTDPSKKK